MLTFRLWKGSTRRRMQKPTPHERCFSCLVALESTTTTGEKKSRVFTPPKDFFIASIYVWKCAKAHVANNDMVVHQVFSHLWVVPTISHCTPQWFPYNEICAVLIIMEVMIVELLFLGQQIFWVSFIAIVTLLKMLCLMAPHFKSTLEINHGAQGRLIPIGVWLRLHSCRKLHGCCKWQRHLDFWITSIAEWPHH